MSRIKSTGSIDEQPIKETCQEAIDFGKKQVLKEAENFIKPSAEEVKIIAKQLVDYAKQLKAQNNSVLEQLAGLNYENESSVLNFSKKMVKSEQEYLNLMERVYNFQNIANEFLGQKVLMTFVSISGTTGQVDLYGFEADVSHIAIEKTAESKGAQYAGRYSKLGFIKKNSQKIINSQYEQNGKKTLDNTFKETWQRYRISKAKFKMGGAAYILWKENNHDWDGRWISGAGPLGEAYVAFFVNEYIFPSRIEPAVKQFILDDKYGVAAVDNASGLLKGDVKKGVYELGVKAKGAQALGYTEIIEYANELLQAADVSEYLKQLKIQLDKGTPNATKILTDIMRAEIEGPSGILTEFEKRINQIGDTFGDSIPVWKA